MLNKLLVIIVIVLSLFSALCVRFYFNERDERERLKANQTITIEKKPDYALYYTLDELKKVVKSDSVLKIRLYKELKIKEKNLIDLKESKSTEKIQIVTILKDTVIYKDSIRFFNWNDRFTNISGFLKKDTLNLRYSSSDTIYIFSYWKREGKFLPCIFGKKKYKTSMSGINPHIKYTVLQNTVRL